MRGTLGGSRGPCATSSFRSTSSWSKLLRQAVVPLVPVIIVVFVGVPLSNKGGMRGVECAEEDALVVVVGRPLWVRPRRANDSWFCCRGEICGIFIGTALLEGVAGVVARRGDAPLG